MPDNSAWNMFIFREGRVIFPGAKLKSGLEQAIACATGPEQIVSALLRAGEYECATADVGSPDAAHCAAITDVLAAALLGEPLERAALRRAVGAVSPPASARVSPPEGFTYYALHPLQFAELANEIPDALPTAVVGIRSIGTTLSAVVTAALRARGCTAGRITVRPTGHPYSRQTCFTPQQKTWLQTRPAASHFLVVDEGPGMSGSSFLSVGEALAEAGIPRERITFLCSRWADPATLLADNAAARWRQFRSLVVKSNRFVPADAGLYIGSGRWRAQFLQPSQWPAAWTHMERLKYLSADGHCYLAFEGLGRFGADVNERARCLAEANFGVAPQSPELGFGRYPLASGSRLTRKDTSAQVLDRIAEYCAFRYAHFAGAERSATDLETPLLHNLKEEFGFDLSPAPMRLNAPCRVVIPDNRLMPHNWIRAGDRLLKLNAAAHGDDHFMPGPTDIAWDLAGAIVEWDLNARAAGYLIARYRRTSGDDPRSRLLDYLLAYSMFRTGYCRMAAAAMTEEHETSRLTSAYQRYRAQTQSVLREWLERAEPYQVRNFEGVSGGVPGRALRAPELQTI